MIFASEKLKVKSEKWFSEAFSIGVFFFFGLTLFFNTLSFAQAISANLKVDSTHIIIGDKLNVKFTLKYSTETGVTLPTVTDTLGNMELLSASKVDTSVSGNNKTLTQSYVVSAYDSGNYHLGPLKIYFKNTAGNRDSILSDFVFVKVATVTVDTSKPFKAIKAPLEVPFSIKEFLPCIIGGIAALILLLVLIYILWRRSKRHKPVTLEKPKPKDPPHIWARRELKKLEEEKLWQNDAVKNYYSRLTDIMRLYLEYRYNWFALESTTEEIEDNFSNYPVNENAKEQLLSILRKGDLVKFAKQLPLPNDNVKAMENAYSFIDLTEAKTEEEKNV
ncbi:MAG: hypothetical protein WCI97_06285 [Bacteroidota bacterium]